MALKKEIFKNLQRKNTFFIIVFSDFTYGEIYKMYLFKAIFTLRENPSAPTVHALPPPPYRQYGYIRQAMPCGAVGLFASLGYIKEMLNLTQALSKT